VDLEQQEADSHLAGAATASGAILFSSPRTGPAAKDIAIAINKAWAGFMVTLSARTVSI
jgi:hypothetical protein